MMLRAVQLSNQTPQVWFDSKIEQKNLNFGTEPNQK